MINVHQDIGKTLRIYPVMYVLKNVQNATEILIKPALNATNLMLYKVIYVYNNAIKDFGKMNRKIYAKNAINSVLNAMEKTFLSV
jgi:hypothetical protein